METPYGEPAFENPDYDLEPELEKHPPKRNRWNLNGKILRFHTTSTVDTQKVRSKLKYKYILIFFLSLSIILTSVGVSGCTTSANSSANNYLLEVQYAPYQLSALSGPGVVNPAAYITLNSNAANKSDLAVRIGYFGTCTHSSTQTSKNLTNWYCSNNVTVLADILTVPTQDIFNVIYMMDNIRRYHVSPAILIISVIVNFLALLVLIIASLERARLYFLSTWLTVFACFMGLVGMVWQQASVNTAANAIQNLSNNSIKTTAGPVPSGLGWTSLFILFCSAIGIVCLVMSERKTLSIIGDLDPNELSEGTYPPTSRQVPDALSVAGSHVPYPTAESQTRARIPHSFE